MKTLLVTLGLASALWGQDGRDVLRERIKTDVRQVVTDEIKANVIFNQPTFEFVSARMVSGPPVKGAPYSAEAVNETIQTLADGNRIVQRNSAMQYRDNDGRERREETSAMGAIFISDPVAGTRYTLHPDAKTAESGPMVINYKSTGLGDTFFYTNSATVSSIASGPGVPAPQAGVFVERTEAGLGRGIAVGGPRTAGVPTAPKSSKTEQLGNMYIEGVQVEGTRTTITIPAGEIGNDRPINVVDERWYSPDLQMTVLTKHSDPRMGETSFALKNINRSNPPSYLFEIPAGYTVKTGPQVQHIRLEARE